MKTAKRYAKILRIAQREKMYTRLDGTVFRRVCIPEEDADEIASFLESLVRPTKTKGKEDSHIENRNI